MFNFKKKTCLCVAADLTSCEAVLKLARVIAPYICALKLHVDIIDDFSKDFIRKLTEIARNNNFVILEDRKLADTGKTVVDQLTRGVYGICSWADVVTVHALPGSSILSSVKSVMKREDSVLKSCLLVAELSTEHSLTALAGYTDAVVDMANEDLDVVSGFICQERCAKDSRFLYWTPGVNLDAVSDGAGQQWKSIEKAIRDQGNDVIIVGRAITGSPDVEKEVKRYRTAAWDAFIQRNDPSADIA
ncbi:hypothetical protein AB6A40_002502 [Gnathostoma spinigerum]|uniref:orotidine-5'-phosphate decarboxylase n=1 Tax=Gnathostoma spinigerum TaxID=75299 RepID=A0ABD6EFU3_9BILA